jgi:DNA polymerase III subunit beta
LYFEISRKELMTPLKMAASVVEAKHTIPVLSHLLLRVENSTLYLVGSDSEVEVSCSLALEQNLDDSANGEITIPGRKFLDIVRSLDDRNSLQFQLESAEEQATIKSGKSRFTLHTLPSDDFPISPEISNDYQIKLPKALLRDLLKQTLFAIANNDVRYYLNGLCFDFKPNGLTVVATDGHRLALALTEFDMDNEALRVIVPKKAVLELERMLDGGEDEIIIHVDENHIKFVLSDALTLSSQLIDGKFPDYEQVIPKRTTKTMTAKVAELKNALTQASILSNEKYRGVKLILDSNMLTVSSRNPEREEAEVHCEIEYQNEEQEDTEKFEIGFNVNYLQDALAVIYTEEVQFYFTESANSCLITPKDITSSKFVVMPMRL